MLGLVRPTQNFEPQRWTTWLVCTVHVQKDLHLVAEFGEITCRNVSLLKLAKHLHDMNAQLNGI